MLCNMLCMYSCMSDVTDVDTVHCTSIVLGCLLYSCNGSNLARKRKSKFSDGMRACGTTVRHPRGTNFMSSPVSPLLASTQLGAPRDLPQPKTHAEVASLVDKPDSFEQGAMPVGVSVRVRRTFSLNTVDQTFGAAVSVLMWWYSNEEPDLPAGTPADADTDLSGAMSAYNTSDRHLCSASDPPFLVP